MKIISKVIISIFLVATYICVANFVSADMGAKPSITVNLLNMKTTEYTIDLLTKNDSEDFYSTILDKYKNYENEPIFKYNEDNWVATTLRQSILWGQIDGNEEKINTFEYFGTPDEFKVIIQFENGEIRVSDIFVRKVLTYNIYLDVNTMSSILDESTDQKISIDSMSLIKCMIFTIVVELLLAYIMKIHYPKTIIIVNIITQILLQFLLLRAFANYLTTFVILEIGVVGLEYLIYRKIFTRVTNKTLLIYTVLANLLTALLTFVVI